MSFEMWLLLFLLDCAILTAAIVIVLQLGKRGGYHGDEHIDSDGKDHDTDPGTRCLAEREIYEAYSFCGGACSHKYEGNDPGGLVCPDAHIAEERGDEEYRDDLRECGECGFGHDREPTEAAT